MSVAMTNCGEAGLAERPRRLPLRSNRPRNRPGRGQRCYCILVRWQQRTLGQDGTSSDHRPAPLRWRLSDTTRPSFRTSCRRRTLVMSSSGLAPTTIRSASLPASTVPESRFPRENLGWGEPGSWGSTIEQGNVIDYLSHKKHCQGAAVHICCALCLLLTRRWRELDSNFRSRCERNGRREGARARPSPSRESTCA
jgi:hypothetical protein